MHLNFGIQMLPEDLQCLKTIALLGGCQSSVWISSHSLAVSLRTSPQTASRRLKSLEEQRLITRGIRSDGQHVTITRGGEEVLHREFSDYGRIFEPTNGRFVLQGNVINGLGEGRYYMSLSHYQQQFSEALGYIPFPGTLNLRLNPASTEIRKKLEVLTWLPIQGFSTENRTFGAARCLPCQIQHIPCAIVIPGRSHYPEDIIEVISEVELRRELRIDENDTVMVEVHS
jgi:riboflavin kinase